MLQKFAKKGQYSKGRRTYVYKAKINVFLNFWVLLRSNKKIQKRWFYLATTYTCFIALFFRFSSTVLAKVLMYCKFEFCWTLSKSNWCQRRLLSTRSKVKTFEKRGKKECVTFLWITFFCRRSEAGTDISALTDSVKSLQFYCYVCTLIIHARYIYLVR